MTEDLARFALEIDLAAIDVLPTAGGMNDSPVKRHMDAEGIADA